MAPRKTRKTSGTTGKSHQDAAVPTDGYDAAVEVTRLQEKLEKLKIKYKTLERDNQTVEKENKILKAEIQTLKMENQTLMKKNLNSQRIKSLSSPQQGGKTDGRGCNCKGNCANKVCGCVKRNVKCAEFCKCNDATCRNQEPDKENIGNANEQDAAKEVRVGLSRVKITNNLRDMSENLANSTPKNKLLEKAKNAKSVFSPSTPESEFVDQELADMTVEFPMARRTLTFDFGENDCRTDLQGKEPENKNLQHRKDTLEVSQFADFNPMKPRHQLIRSPPDGTNTTIPQQCSKVFLSPPEPDEEEAIPPPPKGIEQPEVDWEEHQKQLVPCKRCKRKFFPHRLKKHEANCKKI